MVPQERLAVQGLLVRLGVVVYQAVQVHLGLLLLDLVLELQELLAHRELRGAMEPQGVAAPLASVAQAQVAVRVVQEHPEAQDLQVPVDLLALRGHPELLVPADHQDLAEHMGQAERRDHPEHLEYLVLREVLEQVLLAITWARELLFLYWAHREHFLLIFHKEMVSMEQLIYQE